MSKKSKLAAKEKRLMQKRAKRMANKAKYEQWRREGINGKSKRYVKKVQSKNKGLHIVDNCGNPVCSKCFETVSVGANKIARIVKRK